MATTLDEICDLALTLIDDYRLTALYQTSGSASLNTYLEPWLLMAIDEFDLCSQALSYSTTTQVFTLDLIQQHKNILAQIMTKYWMQKEVQDVNQMRLHLQDRDFKTFAEANNLKEKREFYNTKQEEIDRILQKYGYRNNDWESWENQTFRA